MPILTKIEITIDFNGIKAQLCYSNTQTIPMIIVYNMHYNSILFGHVGTAPYNILHLEKLVAL